MLLTIPLLAMVILWWAPGNRFPSEVLDALAQDSNAIFYSVDNTSFDALSQGLSLSEAPEEEFRGYRILGKVSLDSTDERKSLCGALVKATFQGWDAAACFDPRHGFRVMDSRGTFEVLLCFECGLAQVFYPDGTKKKVYLAAKPDFFNQILTSHGVAVAP
jgi:hypothetical protein